MIHTNHHSTPDEPSNERHRPKTGSRTRYLEYQQKAKAGGLPNGSVHSKTTRPQRHTRVRSAGELLRRFFRLLAPYRSQIVWILVSLTISTLLALIPPAGTKFLVDYVLGSEKLPPEFVRWFPTVSDKHALLTGVLLTVCCVSLLRITVHILGRWYATRITKRIQLDVRRRVFEHAVQLPLHRVQEIRSGGVASILREDGGSVGDLVFGLIYNPWHATIQLTGSLLVLAWVDWKLMTGAVVLLPVIFLTHRTWINRIRPQFRAVRQQREMIDASATEAFAGMRIVRTFGRQNREARRFITENNLMARQELFAWWWMRCVEMTWEIMIPISSAALLYYGGWQVLEGNLTVGDLMMFLVYLLMLIQPLATLASSATQLQNSLSGLDRVLDLLEEPTEMPRTTDSIRIRKGETPVNLQFQNVSFTYPSSETPALKDVNLTIPAGTTVALVGPSGAGKTTLCNLVARFYDPTEGAILLDGTDLKQYDVQSFRSLLGVVEQDVFLFDGTIGDNIAYGRRNATDTEVREAAEAANAMEFIKKMPDGMNTVIGERGVRLSGGQRQRLAIARAILADPGLLILDEATSNLDTESERLIQQSLQKLMQDRTSFVIAHRLSTIAGADMICVVEDGRITQTGTHEELMQKGGKYRHMVEQQVQMTLGRIQPAASLTAQQ
ncbi:MAG: ABC transporter ATP-binding protein [Planctomycetaceae bacterium]|nr:ABC transporter ATP-binding protein [Planctomycetaceae bacterium]